MVGEFSNWASSNVEFEEQRRRMEMRMSLNAAIRKLADRRPTELDPVYDALLALQVLTEKS